MPPLWLHLDQAGEAEKEVVASAAYKQLAADAAYPPLGRVFLARALLDEKLGRPKAAAMRYLHAAWAADDAGPAAAAAECRRRAIIAIEAAQKAGESMGREPGTTEALLADLLRRTGRAQAAKEAVGRGLAVATQPTLRKVLEYERRLAESGDTDRHTVRQAVRAVLDEPVNTPAGTDK